MWPILVYVGPVLLGASVLLARRLIVLPADRSSHNPVDFTIRVAGLVLVLVPFLYPLAGFGLRSGSGPGFVFGGISIASSIILLTAAYSRWHGIERVRLLALLAAAVERGAPLPAVLEAAAAGHGLWLASRAKLAAARLRQGADLTGVVEADCRLFDDTTRRLLLVGARAQAVGPALRAAATIDREDWGADRMGWSLFYAYLVATYSASAVFFLSTKIAPYLVRILRDFGVGPSAGFWVAFLSWLQGTGVGIALGASGTLLIGGVVWGVVRLVARRGWIPLPMVPVGKAFRVASVLDGVALGVEHRLPLPGTLQAVAAGERDPLLRFRLRYLAEEAAAGHEIWRRMHRRGLLDAGAAGLLQAAQTLGDLPAALRGVAAVLRHRAAARLEQYARIALPVVVVGVGGIVLLVALATFSMLSRLIGQLA